MVHRATGSLHSSHVYCNTETHPQPLPPHLCIATPIQSLVVHQSNSTHQLAPIEARVHSELRLPLRPSLPVCISNSLDYRLSEKQPCLKSSLSSHNKLPEPHCSYVLQQMCRILLPPPQTRIINCLLMLTHNWMRSRDSYFLLRQQHRRTSNAFPAISTTYTTEYKKGIHNMNDDLLALRKGLVSLSCAPSCHHLKALQYR